MTARIALTPTALPAVIPGVASAIAAMVLFQVATALSRPLMDQLGATSVTWARMVAAALFLTLWIRPRLRGLPRQHILSALLLGAALAAMSLAAFSAVQRLPLGMVATIAFLGPLGLAVIGAGGRSLGLGALALLGVALILVPLGPQDSGTGWVMDPVGIGLSLAYAAFWALYMVLTRRVGKQFPGRDGLCLSFLAAAVLLAPLGLADLGQAGLSLSASPSPTLLLALAGALTLGLLAPCLTCGLEMQSLRRLSMQSFGILMSLEPAIATLLGSLVMGEVPSPAQFVGMLCVSLASAVVVLLPKSKTEA